MNEEQDKMSSAGSDRNEADRDFIVECVSISAISSEEVFFRWLKIGTAVLGVAFYLLLNRDRGFHFGLVLLAILCGFFTAYAVISLWGIWKQARIVKKKFIQKYKFKPKTKEVRRIMIEIMRIRSVASKQDWTELREDARKIKNKLFHGNRSPRNVKYRTWKAVPSTVTIQNQESNEPGSEEPDDDWTENAYNGTSGEQLHRFRPNKADYSSLKPHSIYYYIVNHLENGYLPEGFSIPWITDMWAPGAHDGTMLNHLHPFQTMLNEEEKEQVQRAGHLICAKDRDLHISEVLEIFEELEHTRPLVCMYDEVLTTITDNARSINHADLGQYGDFLVSYGSEPTSVKLGMIILAFCSPFFSYVENLCMELGAYDEFTYFAARILSNGVFSKGNEDLFLLAQRNRGWGRVYAIDYLNPDTQEIRDWLLYEGADYSTLAQYSADTCLQKADSEGRLSSELSDKEFRAIEQLIRVTLQPGPCPGLTNAERILRKYLTAAKSHPVDRDVIREVKDAITQFDYAPDLSELADALLA